MWGRELENRAATKIRASVGATSWGTGRTCGYATVTLAAVGDLPARGCLRNVSFFIYLFADRFRPIAVNRTRSFFFFFKTILGANNVPTA